MIRILSLPHVHPGPCPVCTRVGLACILLALALALAAVVVERAYRRG